jgi:hypothetical protein
MTSKIWIARLTLLAPAALALGLAGCGGGSAAAPTTTQQAHHTPVLSGADVSHRTVQQAGRSGPANDEHPATRRQLNPCALVTTSEAQAIAGGPVARQVQAPLGPTCIYTFRGSKEQITIAVQTPGLDGAGHVIKGPRGLPSGTPHCPTLATTALTVALPSGKVLHVTAPCPLARPIAVKALSRLTA